MSEKPAIAIDPRSKGKRPVFFESAEVDQIMTFIMELSTEVSVLYDRVDLIERILDEKGSLTRDDIENHKLSDDEQDERTLAREAFIKRVFRMHDVPEVDDR